MKFHLPSFLLGVAAGVAGTAMWERLRPLAVELTAAGYQLAETLWGRVATWQEDAEDVLAEARSRARRRAKVSPIRPLRRARGRRAAR
jgi:hypothetical protein